MRASRSLAAAAAAFILVAQSQTPPPDANSLPSRLQSLGVLDPWMQREVHAVAVPLVQAAGRWRGVQVNDFPRPGWLGIYLVDSQRLPEGTLILDGPVPVGREQLSAGAWTHAESGTILLDTAHWKRLTAATVMTQLKRPAGLPRALATVDASGLPAVRAHWDEAALSEDTPAHRMAGLLMRGALGWALAHEMGHLVEPQAVADQRRTSPQQPPRGDVRLRARAQGCDEFRDANSEVQRAAEREADRFAAELIGRLCLAGDAGRLRHESTVLGIHWFTTAAMTDKVMRMGLAPDRTPEIQRLTGDLLGADLYAQVARSQELRPTKGVIALAFPASHPPDTERMLDVERVLAASPCGASGLSTGQAAALEQVRRQMCRSTAGTR